MRKDILGMAAGREYFVLVEEQNPSNNPLFLDPFYMRL